MTITLNGEKKKVPADITVAGLLTHLNIQHQRVAVELNREIVKKDRYGETMLRDGDSVEVVSFMAGGCRERADHVCMAVNGNTVASVHRVDEK